MKGQYQKEIHVDRRREKTFRQMDESNIHRIPKYFAIAATQLIAMK